MKSLILFLAVGAFGVSLSAQGSILWYQNLNELGDLNPMVVFEENVSPASVSIIEGSNSWGMSSIGASDIQHFETTLVLDREVNTLRFTGAQTSLFDLSSGTFEASLKFISTDGESSSFTFDSNQGVGSGADVVEVVVIADPTDPLEGCTTNAGFSKPRSCDPPDSGDTGSDTGGGGSAQTVSRFAFDWGFISTQQFSIVEISILLGASPLLSASFQVDSQWLGDAPVEPASSLAAVPVPSAMLLMVSALALLGLSQFDPIRRKFQ